MLPLWGTKFGTHPSILALDLKKPRFDDVIGHVIGWQKTMGKGWEQRDKLVRRGM